MLNRFFRSILFLPTILVLSCSSGNSVEDVILDKMSFQEECWNSGNIECFMAIYWKSDSLMFLGSNGLNLGYYQVLERYLKRYPDKETMGELHFEIIRIAPISKDVYQVIGKYYLSRKSMDDAEGYFNLTWKKVNNDWFIVSDATL